MPAFRLGDSGVRLFHPNGHVHPERGRREMALIAILTGMNIAGFAGSPMEASEPDGRVVAPGW
jgi:hypothetical protein